MNFSKQSDKNIYVIVIVMFFMLQGCTNLQTFPGVARAGDTITLAVGSADGMTKSAANTTAVYVPNVGTEQPLTIRSVFNLYPDKRSRLYLTNSETLPVIDSSDHEAWQTVVVLDLPEDLPVGMGSIQFNSIAKFPTITSHINDVPISLEIVSGLGAPTIFTHEFGIGSSRNGDLALLEPLPHAQVTPPSDNTYYGAIELRLTLPTTAAVPLSEENVRVVVDDMTPSTVSNRNVVWGVDNNELVIMLMSPNGFLQTIESRFSIVLAPKISFTSQPVITSLNFFDVNGDPVSGAVATDYSVTLN
ncbi:MAG: hypothetical protein DIZ80_01375 [endosymbiont of Galathealinum brachiosum]|uniref:Uncharacterized protein n=1 Tax=endosymbiont of Galathealinum brachiosum TaxID=2200906 RepID=A0A370DPC2_9GAMM|nr:MAG: hypothetical protein DIZ80_01375 [endosymbiont of Galathealinum brachiosum]